MALYLKENLTFDAARMEVLTEESNDGKGGKNLYLKGICIEGGIKNENQRIYPIPEIQRAVGTINETLKNGKAFLVKLITQMILKSILTVYHI